MITHVVSFRWKPEISAEQIEAIKAALSTMPDLVPTIATYRFGSDLGVNPSSNFDFAIVATFESIDDWRVYDAHPEHDRIRAESIRPWISDRAGIQFES